MCYYLALDCGIKKSNEHHYPKMGYCFEVNGDLGNWKKIYWVKKFHIRGESVETLGCFGHWKAKQNEIENVLKVWNMVEPS